MSTPGDILEFWFGSPTEDGSIPPEIQRRWWTSRASFDDEIRRRFGDTLARAERGELDAWTDTAAGRLALIMVLDQFSRNLYRRSPRAWSNDARAQGLVREGLELGHDGELPMTQRVFFYMPLMHSEDLELQLRAVSLFEGMVDAAPPEVAGQLRGNLKAARSHCDVVRRFGRFPHRNALLGRDTTPQEQAFLDGPEPNY